MADIITGTADVGAAPDPFDELEERLDNPPRDWDPRGSLKDSDTAYRERRVIGTVEERETLLGMQDKSYERLIVKLRGEATRVSIRCWGAVLSSKVRAKDPQPGDRVGLEYQGSKPNSDPSLGDIELYELDVIKAPRAPIGVPEPEVTDPDTDEPVEGVI